MEDLRKEKARKEADNQACGRNFDVDFNQMIEQHRFQKHNLSPHIPSSNLNLCVCVRKRPIFKKEEANGECDSISCANPLIKVMAPKFKVDGISKFVEDSDF